jgi:hypothetical protein
VVLTDGTMLEFSYASTSTYELRGLVWGSVGRANSEVLGTFTSTIAVGCVVSVVGRLATSVVSPAFSALVAERALDGDSKQPVVATETNAAPLYQLLKNTSVIVETSVLTYPAPLVDLIEDTTPVGSTVLMFSRHVVNETVGMTPSDGALSYQLPTLSITPAYPSGLPVTPGSTPIIWLPPNNTSVGLGSDFNLGSMTPPPGQLQGPFSYQWTVQNQADVSIQFTTTDLTQPTLAISNIDPDSVLAVELQVTDATTGVVISAVATVQRFNAPYLAAVVEDLTGIQLGEALVGQNWAIPTGSTSFQIQGSVIPAVPPTVIGPYTYTWTVVDSVHGNPTVTGANTLNPTITGATSGATLVATLTVVATGIPSPLTRTFVLTFDIALVL